MSNFSWTKLKSFKKLLKKFFSAPFSTSFVTSWEVLCSKIRWFGTNYLFLRYFDELGVTITRIVQRNRGMANPRSNPSALRNSEPILETLKGFLGQADKVKVFEVASGKLKMFIIPRSILWHYDVISFVQGTGEHAKYLCNYFAAASWEPTEYDESHMDDIKAHCKHLKNVKAPKVSSNPWDPLFWSLNLTF